MGLGQRPRLGLVHQLSLNPATKGADGLWHGLAHAQAGVAARLKVIQHQRPHPRQQGIGGDLAVRVQDDGGATVLLGINIENQLVYIDKREGNGMLRISSDIGWRRPLHYGMLGMVLMASLERKEMRQILAEDPLQAHTPFSITDQDAFSIRLEQIRDQGYVLEEEEAVEGVVGIAAPIKDYSRQVVAALGIALPVGQRHVKDNLDHFVDLVKQTCETISADLGYLKI